MNLILALLMSITALNLYMRGTHIIVAHAMGTTIGINSMILIACILHYTDQVTHKALQYQHFVFWFLQISLFGFLVSLVLAGWQKTYWRYRLEPGSFSELMGKSDPYFSVMILFGIGLFIALFWLISNLIKQFMHPKNVDNF